MLYGEEKWWLNFGIAVFSNSVKYNRKLNWSEIDTDVALVLRIPSIYSLSTYLQRNTVKLLFLKIFLSIKCSKIIWDKCSRLTPNTKRGVLRLTCVFLCSSFSLWHCILFPLLLLCGTGSDKNIWSRWILGPVWGGFFNSIYLYRSCQLSNKKRMSIMCLLSKILISFYLYQISNKYFTHRLLKITYLKLWFIQE